MIPRVAGAVGLHRRTRALIRGVLTSFLSRGAAALAPLALIPVTLPVLGEQLYGVWMALISVTGMMIWADLGLGNGLLTRLSESLGRKDVAASRQHVSSAYAMTSVVALTALAVVWAVSMTTSWGDLLGAPPNLHGEAQAMALGCLTVFILNIPFALILRVQYAAQALVSGNLWHATGPITSLGLALAAVELGVAPVGIVIAASSGPLMANAICNAWFFSCKRPDLMPKPSAVSARNVRRMLTLGGTFVVISTASAFAMSADFLVVSHMMGSEEVTKFAVPSRIIGVLGLVITLVSTPLWPTNGEALARGDLAWVRRATVTACICISAAVTIFATILMLGGSEAIDQWSGLSTPVPVSLILALCAWWLAVAISSPLAMVQNAAGVLWPQTLGWLAFLILSVPAKILVVESHGVVEMVAAGVVLFTVTVWPAHYVGYRISLRKAAFGRAAFETMPANDS